MYDLDQLSSLDDVAREQLIELLDKMALEAVELMRHALQPVSIELLLTRSEICGSAAAALRSRA